MAFAEQAPHTRRHRRTSRLFPALLLTVLAIAGSLACKLPVRTAAASQAGLLSSLSLPPGLSAISAPEHFGPETLFEIIDGEADLYLKAGFVTLETQTLALNGNTDQWLDLFVYHMDSHRSAFAVFSTRRGPEAKPATVTPLAYRYRDGLFFVHGPFYVEIRAANVSDPLNAAMHTLAETLISAHPQKEAPIPELALFPDKDRIPYSTVLQTAGALGFEGFDALFTTRYNVGGRETTAFLQRCGSREAAARLAADYQSFLLAFDGALQPAAGGPPGSWLMRVLDRYTLVFTRGSVLGGVHDAADPAIAATLARRLYERLSDGEG